MFIEIEASSTITARNVQTQNGARDFYSQPALLWREGEKYPDKFTVPRSEGDNSLPAGKYTIMESTYQIDKFNNLRLNPFQLDLTMFEDAGGKAVKPSVRAVS